MSHAEEFATLVSGSAAQSKDLKSLENLPTANGAWAQFLAGKRKLLGPYEQYCFLLPTAPDTSPINERINSYVEGEINFRPAIRAPGASPWLGTSPTQSTDRTPCGLTHIRLESIGRLHAQSAAVHHIRAPDPEADADVEKILGGNLLRVME